MPLAVVGSGTLKEGTFCLYLLRKFKPASLNVIQALITETSSRKTMHQELSKDEVKQLLNLAESESERERLKYTFVKSSGISNTKAKGMYGFCNMSDRKRNVEEAMEKACAIKDAIENIANVKENVLLQSLGICETDGSEESNAEETVSETDTDNTDVTEYRSNQIPELDTSEDGFRHQFQDSDFVGVGEAHTHGTDYNSVSMNVQKLCGVLRKCDLNWVYFARELKQLTNFTSEASSQLLLDFSGQLPSLGFTVLEVKVIDQSMQAFMYAECQSNHDENDSDDASVEITSDSGSSEAEIWARGVQSPMDERGKLLIKKRRASIRLKSMRQIKKRLAEERLMKRRRSKKVGKIISECPGIGEEIEDFVKQCGAGADAWRRTGIMTFVVIEK